MKTLWTAVCAVWVLPWAASAWGAAPWDEVSPGEDTKNVQEEKTLQLTGGFGITQDITERKKIEKALQEAHADLERQVE